MDIRQRTHLEILVKNKGFDFTDTFFPYTSGQIGPYYVNSEVVMNDGLDYHHSIEAMCNLIIEVCNDKGYNPKNSVISGGESRDWIFSLPVSSRLEMPHLMIYKNMKTSGPDIKGKNVFHVADLNNEGSSPRDKWVPTIKKLGGSIKDIFFYVDRLEDGSKVMKELGLESHCIVPLNADSWDHLLEYNKITDEIYRSLRERMENKDEWAKKMLRSDAGYKKWVELWEKEPNKAANIVTAGYLDIKSEMMGRLSVQDREVWNNINPCLLV